MEQFCLYNTLKVMTHLTADFNKIGELRFSDNESWGEDFPPQNPARVVKHHIKYHFNLQKRTQQTL